MLIENYSRRIKYFKILTYINRIENAALSDVVHGFLEGFARIGISCLHSENAICN